MRKRIIALIFLAVLIIMTLVGVCINTAPDPYMHNSSPLKIEKQNGILIKALIAHSGFI